MEILPAIDIRGGRAVQLAQGDYARETVFNPDPVAAARRWVDDGASRLHIVDLDGAREGRPVNRGIVERIAAAVPVPVQIGGGVRTAADALAYCDVGVARVILGTSAVEDRALVAELTSRLGDALIVGIDARDGCVMTHGWLRNGNVGATELGKELRALGVARFVYTDIARDGMLQGPNLTSLTEFMWAVGCPVVASGGISSLEQVLAVAATGAESAIIGTALYTGAVVLAEVLSALDAQVAGAAGLAGHARPA